MPSDMVFALLNTRPDGDKFPEGAVLVAETFAIPAVRREDNEGS